MNVLIVKLSSIGDVIHTLPAAAAIRRAVPEARITWVVERRASEILKGAPVIDRLIEIDTRSWRKHPLGGETTLEIRARLSEIRGGDNGDRIDVAIDFQGLIKSGFIAWASGAGRRVGFETSELREKATRVFLTEQVETSHVANVIDKNVALAIGALSGNGAGQSTEERLSSPGGHESSSSNGARHEFPIVISPEDERYADGIISTVVESSVKGSNVAGFAILNPGGGWPTKLWDAKRYGRIADFLWERYGLVSLITYGPGEESLASRVSESALGGAAQVVPSTLKQFVALARRAKLFVGGDTGPLHLAAASGTPIVGLYGPTSPDRNGPFDSKDLTVGRDLWCRENCHRRECWHWECMEIEVAEVEKAVAKRIEDRLAGNAAD